MSLFLRNMIAVIGFVIITVSCGGKQDNRIVLSSESEDHLTIPRGDDAGKTIDRQKLAVLIADRFNDISRVYDISFLSELYLSDEAFRYQSSGMFMFDTTDYFTISFTAETTSGAVYSNIKCLSTFSEHMGLQGYECRNNQALLDKEIEIPYDEISVTRQSWNPFSWF